MSPNGLRHPADVTIQSVTVDDAEDIAINQIHAFWTDPSWILIWPGKTREYVAAQQVLRMPATLLDEPEARRVEKAVDTTGQLLGHARWTLPHDCNTDSAGDLRETFKENPVMFPLARENGEGNVSPAAANINVNTSIGEERASNTIQSDPRTMEVWTSARVPRVSEELQEQFIKQREAADWNYDRSMDVIEAPMMEMKEKLLKGKNYIVLDVLAVTPAHRNRGIATCLVQSGIKQADSLGLCVFVHAMKAGLGVYYRAGFELLDSIVLDDSPWGGTGEYWHYFMIRKPVIMKQG